MRLDFSLFEWIIIVGIALGGIFVASLVGYAFYLMGKEIEDRAEIIEKRKKNLGIS